MLLTTGLDTVTMCGPSCVAVAVALQVMAHAEAWKEMHAQLLEACKTRTAPLRRTHLGYPAKHPDKC